MGGDLGGIVSKMGRRTFEGRNRRHRDARRGDSDWRAARVAVTKTATLLGLVAAVRIVVEMPGKTMR